MTEEELQLGKETEQQELGDIAFFCQRLARANLCRRKQFEYWINHPDVPETQTTAMDAVGKANQQEDEKSDIGDSVEIGQLRTVHPKSVVGLTNVTRVPEVPKRSKTDSNFECPICHTQLDSGKMQERET